MQAQKYVHAHTYTCTLSITHYLSGVDNRYLNLHLKKKIVPLTTLGQNRRMRLNIEKDRQKEINIDKCTFMLNEIVHVI